MSFFVAKTPVAISDDRGNCIWIAPKMGIGIQAAVSADFVRLGGTAINAHQLCLLRHNILRWEGPDFTDIEGQAIPCSHANIDRLDSDIPIIKAALDKIYELNRAKGSEDEADPTPAVANT